LRSLHKDWGWHQTDFFVCGNAQMVQEVCQILEGGHGVAKNSIHKEVFFMNRSEVERTLELEERVMRIHKRSA
jgi:ferredoxin-NADP reductase